MVPAPDSSSLAMWSARELLSTIYEEPMAQDSLTPLAE